MLCMKCGKLLLKRSSLQPLRPGEMIEIKCRACNELSYLVGQPVEERTATVQSTQSA